MVLLLAVVFLFLHRRNCSRTGVNKYSFRSPNSPKTPNLPMQDSMVEAGLSRIRPDPSVPVLSTYQSPSQPSSAKMGRHSIAPSYYSDPSYASDVSSLRSLTALVSKVSQSPVSARLALGRLASPRSLDPVMIVNGSPRRPSRRPPPLDIR